MRYVLWLSAPPTRPGSVDLDAVETGGLCVRATDAVLFDDSRDLPEFKSARCHERLHSFGGPGLTFRPYRRRSHGQLTVQLQRRMRNASDMPELKEMWPPFA